jgi:predicted glycogen debranching enzyme
MIDDRREWLEPDGLGGFASGTVTGTRTRRYHALLLVANRPPTERLVLVNGMEVWIDAGGESHAISCQRYADGAVFPDPTRLFRSFDVQPWPTWTFELPTIGKITQEILVVSGKPLVLVIWKAAASSGGRIRVRPLLSGRDYHQLHHENIAFNFAAQSDTQGISWQAYDSIPRVYAASTGIYQHDPVWYRQFYYAQEAERGLDCVEDLASPGIFELELRESATLAFSDAPLPAAVNETALALRAVENERRKRPLLERSADAYIVSGTAGQTILAGYPWFTDWGRDTMISLRGLCLARGKLSMAADILSRWGSALSDGLLPNRFPDRGENPEYNSVDASLWFVIAVHELDLAAPENPALVDLRRVVEQILHSYMSGTHYGIGLAEDGLLHCGAPGVQLTWMDAMVNGKVITPRVGKPVEVEALWINALWVASNWDSFYRALLQRALTTFQEKFWNGNYLFDVVDVEGQIGRCDPSFRPNQIFAVGGLPLSVMSAEEAAKIVASVEHRLVTPAGLRSLDPDDPAYCGHYVGGPQKRDAAYHQGTVWPWLMGAFVDAWIKTYGPGSEQEAFGRFVDPLVRALAQNGIGHLYEIADGDPPFVPRGCPFQAWSVGELVRLLKRYGANSAAAARLLL